MGEPATPHLDPIRLVVMDDNEGIVTLLRLNAEFDERFDVVGSASEAAEAIELSRRLRPDAVVLDNFVGGAPHVPGGAPAMTGSDAIAEIRSLLPEVFVVMYTGSQPPASGAGGVDLYFVKDVGPAALFDLIASALGRGN